MHKNMINNYKLVEKTQELMEKTIDTILNLSISSSSNQESKRENEHKLGKGVLCSHFLFHCDNYQNKSSLQMNYLSLYIQGM